MDDKTRISPDIGAAAASTGPGTRLSGIYELDELIATGGMGQVYRGHNIETGDKVAIKIVLPEFARDQTILALFRKEASILNHLSHDAIVRYHVFTVDQGIGRPYLAMEFVDGDALFDIMQRGPMSTQDVRHLCHRLALGLTAVHEAGAIHRDLSPDNVILPGGRVDRAKIIDFGIARSTHAGGETLIGGKFAGKYNFVSPEQLGLNGGKVSDKSDIYSLGLVLAAALRGKPLEMSGSQLEIIEKRRAVPDLLQIDAGFRPIIEAMLQPDPEDRPSSAELAMMTSLNALEADVASSAGQPGRLAAFPGASREPTGKPRFVTHKPASLPPKQRPTVSPARAPAPGRSGGGSRTVLAVVAVLAVLAGAGAYMTGFVSFGRQPIRDTQPTPPVAVLTPAPVDKPEPIKPSEPAVLPEPVVVAEPVTVPDPAAVPAPVVAPEPIVAPPTSVEPQKAETPAPVEPTPPVVAAQPTVVAPPPPVVATAPASEPPDTPPVEPAGTSGPAIEAASPDAAKTPEPPVVPPAAEEPPPAEPEQVAALPRVPEPAPPPTVDPLQAVAWVAGYEGGSCFFASAPVATAEAVSIDGLGTAAAPFEEMASAFEETFKLKPALQVQTIEPTQCAVTEFLKTTTSGTDGSPRLTLESTAVSEGVPLAGVLSTGGASGTSLYLIDHKGMVFNLTERVDIQFPEADFSIPIGLGAADKAAGLVAQQLLLAVTGTDGVDAASFTRPVPAVELFPRMVEEAKAKGRSLAATAQPFRLGE